MLILFGHMFLGHLESLSFCFLSQSQVPKVIFERFLTSRSRSHIWFKHFNTLRVIYYLILSENKRTVKEKAAFEQGVKVIKYVAIFHYCYKGQAEL